ncbi:trophoblast glyco -like, partial [Brachionus plicatilis]
MMLFILLLFFFAQNTNADLSCPFESCSSTYNSSGCTILCESQDFPPKSQMIDNRIFKLSFTNLKNIPKDAFEGLKITTLEIECQNVEFVDEKAFSNVQKLDNLILSNVKNFSIFSDKIQILSNITLEFSVSNAGLTETSVVSFLESLKTWKKLKSLSITNNHLVHFKYDFNVFFHNLKTLTISHNSIEIFDIKCHNLSTLNIYNNQITKLDKEMLLNLP